MSSAGDSPIDFFYPSPGVTVLGDRFKCVRPLDRRPHSTVWLAEDLSPRSPKYLFCRSEIFSRSATEAFKAGILNEIQVRKAVWAKGRVNELARTIADGEINGPAGSHYFLSYDGVCETISSVCLAAPTHTLKPYIVKYIVKTALSAVEVLEEFGVVHTEVNADNIQREAVSVQDVITDLNDHPPQLIGEVIVNGEVQLEYSSRMMTSTRPLWDVPQHIGELESYELELVPVVQVGQRISFGNFSSQALVAPEAIIGCKLTPAYGIWGAGCLAFKLLLGEDLFNPVAVEGKWSLEEDLLAQIFEITGERFGTETLDQAQEENRFLDGQGNLLTTRRPLRPTSFRERIASHGKLDEEETTSLANFLKLCLRVDPCNRSVETLELTSEWVHGWMHE